MKNSEKLKVIEKIKKEFQSSDTYKDLCKKHKLDSDHIELVPICFKPLDVSARTENGIIYLNEKLLNNLDSVGGYLCHEYTHTLQQTLGEEATEGSTDDTYLDNAHEIAGFAQQTKYISETKGDDEALDYIEKVMDHHKVPESERQKRRRQLLKLHADSEK